MIAAVDEFVLYDDVQLTKNNWRNPNQIKTPQGMQWITVLVKVRGKYDDYPRNGNRRNRLGGGALEIHRSGLSEGPHFADRNYTQNSIETQILIAVAVTISTDTRVGLTTYLYNGR